MARKIKIKRGQNKNRSNRGGHQSRNNYAGQNLQGSQTGNTRHQQGGGRGNRGNARGNRGRGEGQSRGSDRRGGVQGRGSFRGRGDFQNRREFNGNKGSRDRGGLQGRGRGRGRGRGAFRGNDVHQPPFGNPSAYLHGASGTEPEISISIYGWTESTAGTKPDTGKGSLLGFLKKKSMKPGLGPLQFKKPRVEGDYLYVRADAQNAQRLLEMNNCQFSGHPLTIEMSTQENPEMNFGIRWNLNEIQEGIVLEYLNSVYDKDRKLLDLSSLSENAGLRASGLVDSTNNLTGLLPAIIHVIEGTLKTKQERTNMVESIRLAHNQLRNVYAVARLAQIFPNLLNLDLSYNDFSDLRSLSSWRLKFRGLQNLQISQNPIELLASDEDYMQELLRWFPSLQVLNSHQVRTPEQVAAALEEANAISRSAYISPIPINSSDFRDTTRKTGENFVLEFFARYDNDWEGIAREFYDDQSVHSISINMTAPHLDYQTSQPQSWDIYRNHSRNLADAYNRGHGRTSHYYRGLNSILNLWALLPPTRHADARDQLRYRVECHIFQGLPGSDGQMSGAPGLILMVHGDFVELHLDGSDKGLRGFSRTFVLGPGYSADSPVRVVSDMLMLRTWCPLPNQKTKDVDTLETGKVSEMAQLASNVERFSQETGLLSSWAELLLTRNDWDWHNALRNFNAIKAKFPPDAFRR